MRKLLNCLSIGIALILSPMTSSAALVTLNATGDPTDVSGYIQFDDSYFNGTSNQHVDNIAITDLSLTVLGTEFLLADLAPVVITIIDSSGNTPIIIGGSLIADNGSQTIAFAPDGSGGTALDGDAALQFGYNLQLGLYTYHHVKWEATVVPIPAAAWLFGSGLIGLVGVARRKKV